MREGSAVLAASERSGIVMGLAKRGTERYGRFYLKGRAEITWEADESIAPSRARPRHAQARLRQAR
jgi:hypothetical protein